MHALIAVLCGVILAGCGYVVADVTGALAGLAVGVVLGSGLTTFNRKRKASLFMPAHAPCSFDLNDPAEADLALGIAGEYGVAMENSGVCRYRSASSLPYPKESIRGALEALLRCAEGISPSAYLSASGIAPSAMTESLRTGLVSLDDYLDVPTKFIPVDSFVNAVFGDAIREGKSVSDALAIANLRRR